MSSERRWYCECGRLLAVLTVSSQANLTIKVICKKCKKTNVLNLQPLQLGGKSVHGGSGPPGDDRDDDPEDIPVETVTCQ